MCDDDPVSMMFQWIVTAVLINVKSSILYSITGMKIMDILTVGRFIYFFFFCKATIRILIWLVSELLKSL